MRATLTSGCLVLAAASLAIACGEGDPSSDDAGTEPADSGTTPVDSGSTVDAGGDEDAGGGPVDSGTPPLDASSGTCGGARPTITGITGTEGLVIGRDGTIYYSQAGGVGRLVPGGAPEDDWVRISGASTVWGMVPDAANETLYVGSPATGTIYAIDLTAASPAAAPFLTGAGAPNGLTMGPDGALYYSDFGGNRVYRVALGGATGTRTQVTASPISGANGVAFLPDGTLLVASYGRGNLIRLTLTDGAETGRTTFATGLGAPDGVAVDADGRVYVTDNAGGRLIRLEADGTGPMTLMTGISAAASVEFGAGALDCEDVYVASSGAARRYEDGTVAGAAVPWH